MKSVFRILPFFMLIAILTGCQKEEAELIKNEPKAVLTKAEFDAMIKGLGGPASLESEEDLKSSELSRSFEAYNDYLEHFPDDPDFVIYEQLCWKFNRGPSLPVGYDFKVRFYYRYVLHPDSYIYICDMKSNKPLIAFGGSFTRCHFYDMYRQQVQLIAVVSLEDIQTYEEQFFRTYYSNPIYSSLNNGSERCYTEIIGNPL